DFDRPTDVAFLCMGIFGDTDPLLSGRPITQCHPSDMVDPTPDRQHKSFAFVPSSGTGELSVLNADTWKFIDLDPAVGTYNRLPLGIFPEQIAASDDGCQLVTANRGSCNFSLIDPARLLAPTLAKEAPGVHGDGDGASLQTVY